MFFFGALQTGDHATKPLVQPGFKLLHAADVHLADGNETPRVAHSHFQAALIVAGDPGLDHHAGGQVVPIRVRGGGALQGELHQSVCRVVSLDAHLHLGTKFWGFPD